ncbi:MAG: ACT domain-containing protein [Gammaproteobacteria bacterium]
MQNYLVVSALIDNSDEIVHKLTKLVKASGCNISESRFNVLGDKRAIMLFLDGSWNEIAKMEDMLNNLGRELSTTILIDRTTMPAPDGKSMPYAIDVVGIDQPGVILEITQFMTKSKLAIHDMFSNNYRASSTGAKMFSLHMTINIPMDTSIASVRGDFIDFCDRLNLDAIMEPVK